jgi:2-iminobutanoate/2-iminopropanoate deaminase
MKLALTFAALLIPAATLLPPAGAALAQAPAKAAAPAPFSVTRRVGDTVYLSGTIGTDPAMGKPPADPAVEAQQLLANVKKALATEGMSLDDLVSVTVFCTDMKLYALFNKVYVGEFHQPYPARAFIGVNELVFGSHFELMGVAIHKP